MTGTDTTDIPPERRASRPPTIWIIVAALLVVVIILVAIVLITKGLPALRKNQPTETVVAAIEPTLNPTFTPAQTQAAAGTPVASVVTPTETAPAPSLTPVMGDVISPTFVLKSAGARPSTDWTGFFGQVLDAQGKPLAGVPVVVWFADARGTLAAPVDKTDSAGNYEIRLADGVYAGTWSIQVLTPELEPASKLQTFRTDENTQTGIQQIQVMWQQVP